MLRSWRGRVPALPQGQRRARGGRVDADAEGTGQGRNNQATHRVRAAEADLGLARMDVHIDLIGRQIEEQRHHRMAAMGDDVAERHPDSGAQGRVGDRPAIDHQGLRRRGGTRDGRRADVTGQDQPVALPGDFDQGGIFPEHRGNPTAAILCRQVEQHPSLAFEAEGDARGCQCQAVDRGFAGVGLGARRFKEFAPRRGGEEQVANHDAGALGAGAGNRGLHRAAFDTDGGGVIGVGGAGGNFEPGGSTNAGQRLATEAQRVDAQQIVVIDQLGCCVALHGEREVIAGHARTVIGDLNAVHPASYEGDGDAGGAGVDRVFNQFAGGGGGPLDNLTGGDAVDGNLRQQADAAGGHGYGSPRRARKRAIRAAVDGSCGADAVPFIRSGSRRVARTLPSSTPHWSKLSMVQMQPCTATLCS